jgi:hypothetical protein
MDYLILGAIGILMGLFGGLLGIGGSIVMIPALVFTFGENQHLYQASAMICNFFVAAAATLAHKKAQMLMNPVIKLLVPAAVLGVVLGVMLSNCSFFAGERSYLLARLFGVFLTCVAIHNVIRFYRNINGAAGSDEAGIRQSAPLTITIGLITGLGAGLLGLGGGSVCVPLQYVLLRISLKRAIANSAATIILTAVIGAILKNATLNQHNVAIIDSVKMAGVVIPTAIIGGFAGARLMHLLPRSIVRIVFILLMLVASYKMLTIMPVG